MVWHAFVHLLHSVKRRNGSVYIFIKCIIYVEFNEISTVIFSHSFCSFFFFVSSYYYHRHHCCDVDVLIAICNMLLKIYVVFSSPFVSIYAYAYAMIMSIRTNGEIIYAYCTHWKKWMHIMRYFFFISCWSTVWLWGRKIWKKNLIHAMIMFAKLLCIFE